MEIVFDKIVENNLKTNFFWTNYYEKS